MGSSASKGCCGDGSCFSGLRSGRMIKVTPDMSPGLDGHRFQTSKVNNYEEALNLPRPRKGSWQSPKAWASPAPMASPAPQSLDGDMSWQLVIDEVGKRSPEGAAIIDTDGPRRHSKHLLGSVKEHRSKYEVEQLLASPGNLPKPMAPHERENVIRELMPTATFEMLSKLPPEYLRARSDEAQALRRKLVQGSTIVFVSAGLQGKRFILERAASLGVKSVVIDHPDSWSRTLVAEGVIAKFLPVDMSQSSDTIFKECLRLIRELGDDGTTGAVDGITTFIELSVPLVARLCEAMGLPGFRPDAVDNARDKHRTRAALKAAGLPTPKNYLITKTSELEVAGTHVGFPAVLKPVSGAASLGVKKVTSAEELQRCYSEVVEEMSSLVVSSGALIKGTPNGTGVSANKVVDLTLLLEQYLDGGEVDVDVVMSGGEWCYACVSDNGPTLEPYFNETWAVCPSLLPKQQQLELRELAIGSVKALGFESGIFHVECKYTSTGPQLIEVNARMGGGQVRECNLLSWGVDLVEETLFCALGIPARPNLPSKPLVSVAYCYVNAKKSGTMGSIDGIKKMQSEERVVWAKPLVRPGDAIVGPQEGLPTWLCDLLVTGSTPQEALQYLHKLEAELTM